MSEAVEKIVAAILEGESAEAEVLVKEELDQRKADLVAEGKSFVAASLFEVEDETEEDDEDEDKEDEKAEEKDDDEKKDDE